MDPLGRGSRGRKGLCGCIRGSRTGPGARWGGKRLYLLLQKFSQTWERLPSSGLQVSRGKEYETARCLERAVRERPRMVHGGGLWTRPDMHTTFTSSPPPPARTQSLTACTHPPGRPGDATWPYVRKRRAQILASTRSLCPQGDDSCPSSKAVVRGRAVCKYPLDRGKTSDGIPNSALSEWQTWEGSST